MINSIYRKYKSVIHVFIITRLLIFLTGIISYTAFHRELPPEFPLWKGNTPSESMVLRIWERFDANNYINIVNDGYSNETKKTTNSAFFPLYPFAGYLLNHITGNTTLSLLLVSNISFFFALIFLYKLLLLDYEKRIAERTILYISIFPFAVSFFGVFSESLFLLNLTASIYYIRKGNYIAVLFWGIMLTATRLVGLVIIPVALWEYYSERDFNFLKTDLKVFLIPLMSLGLAAYMFYNNFIFGSYFTSFDSSNLGWMQRMNWPWVSFIKHFNRIIAGTEFRVFYFDIAFSVLFIVLLIYGYKKVRTSYSIMTALLILIPISSNTLKSMPRYGMIAFPLFIILSLMGKDKFSHWFIVRASVFCLIIITIMYANWYYIG